MTMILPFDGAATAAPTPIRTAIAKPAVAKPAVTRRRGRRWLIATFAILLGGAGASGWWYTQQVHAQAPVATVTVSRGDLQETVLATGTLAPSTLVSVGAQVSGIIKTVDVKLGDTVKAGDAIAEIDSLNQENALKAAQAALDNVNAQKSAEEANLAKDQKALDRAKSLGAGDLISQSDYDTADANVAGSEAQLKSLDAQIEQATLNVQSAQLSLDRTRITSPANGTVVAVLVDPGQTVNAAQSAPTIVKIANLDTMEIEAKISEADVSKVQVGQQVYFTVLGDPADKIEATLKSIDPAPASIADDTTATDAAIYYNGVFEVPNPDHALRISMTAKVTIVLKDAANVLTLPSSAIGTAGKGGTYHVQVLDPATGTATPREITVGLNNKVSAEITNGLNEGDQVVVKSASATTSSSSTAATSSRGPGGVPPMGL